MGVCARRFPFEKAVVLNVLYDALDAIGFSIEKSDSMCGSFLVSFGEEKEKMRIAISPSLTEEKTLVEVFTAEEGLDNRELGTVLFDEMQALIKRAELTDI